MTTVVAAWLLVVGGSGCNGYDKAAADAMAVAAIGKGKHINQPAAVGGGINFFIIIEKGRGGDRRML